MGQIRTYQTEYLYKGTEQINYKVFNSEGVYQETKDENVLVSCPEQLVPLDRSLLKRYEKPLKEATFLTELAALNYINQNSQFLYGTDEWTLGTSVTNMNIIGVVESSTFTVKPLSGNKYFKVQGGQVDKPLIKSDISTNTVRQGVPIEISFSYHVTLGTASSANYRYPLFAIIDTTGNGTPDYMYDFEENKWITYANDAASNPGRQFDIKNTIINKWVGFTKTIEPFEYDTNDNDVNISVGLLGANGLGLTAGDMTYIDNFTIGEKIEFNFTKVKNVRSRFSYTGGFTEKYETKNIMSNELKDDDNFVGQIEGDFERPRDSVTKTLEAIITQEIVNDNRDYMTKYEGVFRNVREQNVGLHNKLWIDFGVDTLQEEVSCYLDAMTFNIKAAEYDIKMHIPNQDDDALSTYKTIAE